MEDIGRDGGKISMECNRDEAIRAKQIAERKFQAKDIKGAKKFALKAQNLYPELDGISQMVMTLDVYLSAEEKKIYGESNWYGVLGVTPFSDDEVIRKQFRKLALLLHPDKNRFIGAEGAFQLISQAWSLLSDKPKRIAYDQRYGSFFQQRSQTTNGDPSTPPMQNGFYDFSKNAASHPSPKTNSSKRDGIPKCSNNRNGVTKDNSSKKDFSSGVPSSHGERQTFWTVCLRCRMQYEYLRMYLNRHLLCPNCQEAYFAIEIPPPSSRGSKTPSQSSNSKQWQHTSHQGSNAPQNNSSTPNAGTSGFNRSYESNNNNFQWAPFSEPKNAASAVQASKMVKRAYEKVKRERQKAQNATRKEEAVQRKHFSTKRTSDTVSSGHSDASKRRKEETIKPGICETGIIRAAKFSVLKDSSQKHMDKNDSECRTDIKQFLMEKGREEIHKKLNELIPDTTMRNQEGVEVHENIKENEILNNSSCMYDSNFYEPLETKSQIPLNKLHSSNVRSNLGSELVDHVSVNVSKPDFHDFERDRTVKCFKDNQVWAVYDDADSMPRHYAMIHSVISLNPFKVRMSWLYSITNSGLGYLNWYANGFSKTCGEFRTGRLELCTSSDCFSHQVRWQRCTHETIQIFPRKWDVWALYRNWSSEWSELTEDEVVHKYDFAEVLESYDENFGIIVIPLVKVAGFKAVFHQHSNPDEIRRIPVEEMSQFSHQVPSHLLTGQEGSKSLNGCLELDPAAVPSEILQVLSEIKEIELLEADNDVELEKIVDCDGSANSNMVMEIDA